jgi:hypothetical protein
LLDFEPIYSTPREESVVRFIAERYALPPPLDCRLLNRGFNDIYLVVTTTASVTSFDSHITGPAACPTWRLRPLFSRILIKLECQLRRP